MFVFYTFILVFFLALAILTVLIIECLLLVFFVVLLILGLHLDIRYQIILQWIGPEVVLYQFCDLIVDGIGVIREPVEEGLVLGVALLLVAVGLRQQKFEQVLSLLPLDGRAGGRGPVAVF